MRFEGIRIHPLPAYAKSALATMDDQVQNSLRFPFPSSLQRLADQLQWMSLGPDLQLYQQCSSPQRMDLQAAVISQE